MKPFRSFSLHETKKFGEALAKKIAKRGLQKKAAVLALSGELGTGKTTFVQGFFKGLGSRKRSPSPTFIIMRRTALPSSAKASAGRRAKKFSNVFHVDAYRIKKSTELGSLGLKEIFSDPRNIVLIEWAENIKKILPKNTTWVKFHHGEKGNQRTIFFVA